MTWRNTVRIMDVLDYAATLPAGSVQTIVTSPPYFGLRSYLTADHPSKTHELGSEQTPDEYVARLVAVFRALAPALRDDGTLWVNLGSSYVSGIIESDEYVIRDDLTGDEQAYVYAELAKYFGAKSAAVSDLWTPEASPERGVSSVLRSGQGQAAKLPHEGV